MVWIDVVILVIIALSAVISVIRGFVREALSLAAWILAFWVALTFSGDLAALFSKHISTPSVRMIAAFAILFIVTLLLAALVSHFAAQLVKKTGLSGTDRMLGVIFGIARGVVIVALLVLLAGLTPLPADPWWKESIFIVHFQTIALWILGFLPPDIASNFKFA
jgi:membrane protein required for colicin V production